MIAITPSVIRSDKAGDGHFGASRGSRKHVGVDFVCSPGDVVFSPVDGRVTKHGYPYGDDLTWRYIQITDDKGQDHRLFYCRPLVGLGESVFKGEIIGEAQDISERYPGQGMTAHIHYEIKKGDDYIDPGA